MEKRALRLTVHPLTPDRWADFEALFNCRGGSIARSCWCMHYRLSGNSNVPPGAKRSAVYKQRMQALVRSGTVPGLLAYEGSTPVGWISLGPREQYARLQSSPVMKPLDDKPVWSVVCFFVDPRYREQGVCQVLLKAAVRFAREHGVTLLESYPVDKPERSISDFMWFGAKSLFERAGFREVARRKPTRPFMRKTLRGSSV
jgi:GNAT superfamily N-acetyltransferase